MLCSRMALLDGCPNRHARLVGENKGILWAPDALEFFGGALSGRPHRRGRCSCRSTESAGGRRVWMGLDDSCTG